ncbi:hypothetical protein MKW98_032041 [Papaver atlanticum]|uniref:F-box domain-containing protein n=1 Tax=Papaver atlanticum TaxID=357466 RepID=A0AAD4SFN9_9MAGN|nr:hypothetical protein MKW98_032041 [Papaver atlanticum]
MEGEEVDRISKLPDNLIHEILSFIDTKYAVQTSVLSKRWKNIWISLPYISLDWTSFKKDIIYDLGETVNRFLTFVDKVFEFHDDSDIQSIKLGCVILDAVSVDALNRWILAAVNYNVKDLDISGSYLHDSAYEIPHQLLNSKSLKSLIIILLGERFGGTNIILQKSMSLPQMKTLWLAGISISNLDLQRLFSSCPLIETVIMQKCDVQTSSQSNIIIDSHSLKMVRLFDNRHTHIGLADHSMTCTTNISAPNLKVFMCTGFLTEDFPLENLSSLGYARFDMRLRKEADETAQTYSELPVLLQAPGILDRQPPQLCNLKTMKLGMRFTRGCIRSIAYLLKISPIIITLILVSEEVNLADIGDDWDAGLPLTCMYPRLKFIEIKEVEGCDNELKFLRFMLKNSTVLEKVNLFFRSTSDSLDGGRRIRGFKRNLRAMPTSSSGIKMNFF